MLLEFQLTHNKRGLTEKVFVKLKHVMLKYHLNDHYVFVEP